MLRQTGRVVASCMADFPAGKVPLSQQIACQKPVWPQDHGHDQNDSIGNQSFGIFEIQELAQEAVDGTHWIEIHPVDRQKLQPLAQSPQYLRKGVEHASTKERSPISASPTDHDKYEDLDSEEDVECGRIYKGCLVVVERTREPGNQGAQAKGQEFDADDVDAHDLGSPLGLMDRIHGPTEARPLEPGEEYDQADNNDDDVVERIWIIANAAKALRTADVVPAQSDDRDDLGKSECQQEQIDALDAQGRKTNEDPDQARKQAAEQQREGERDCKFLRRDSGRIRADGHETCLAEGNLASLERDVEAVGCDHVDAGKDQQRERVAVNEPIQHRSCYLSCVVRVPNRPVGRQSRMRMRIRNEKRSRWVVPI